MTTLRTAAQQALEALETVFMPFHPAVIALKAALAEPVQEPFCYHDGRNIVGKEYADHSDVFPLYTHPPQRKPLTEEEIYGMYSEPSSDAEMVEFARAIEKAHGIA